MKLPQKTASKNVGLNTRSATNIAIKLLAISLLSMHMGTSNGDDWPQWQGPNRNAISSETGLLKEWPAQGPALAWRVENLGGGDSAPAVVDGKLFGMSNRDGKEIVWAISEEDGSPIWSTPLGDAVEQRMRQSKEGPGGTPTVDGDHLYVIGMGGRVACLQRSNGSLVWERQLTTDFGGKVPPWSYRESALVDGDRVICTPGGPEAIMVALNKKTGETLWTSRTSAAADQAPNAPGTLGGRKPQGGLQPLAPSALRPGALRPGALQPRDLQPGGLQPQKIGQDDGVIERGGSFVQPQTAPPPRDPDAPKSEAGGRPPQRGNGQRPGGAGFGNRGGGGRFGRGGSRPGAGYSSAIAIDFEGQRQYVQLTAKSLIGVAADTGQILWQYDAPANAMGINCSTPIYQDGILFAASAYGNGGGAIKLKKQNDGSYDFEELYFTSSMQNHHGGMIVIDGALYGANGGNGGGMMTGIDFQTGDVLWKERKGPKGAVAYADERLYLRSEEGPIVLVEPSKDGYLERGRFDQPDRSSSKAWAHPVIANGKLYIRDQNLLLCYDIQAK